MKRDSRLSTALHILTHLAAAEGRPIISEVIAAHLVLAMFEAATATRLVDVPYKGSAPQVNDLLGGQVPLGFTQLQTALPHIPGGKLNAIAVTGPQRSRFLPQVPTLAELGYKDLNTTIWFGLMAPAATPKPVIDAIEAAVMKVQADPEYRARLDAQGFDVPSESGEAFARTIAAETARWADLVKATGFKAND